MIGAILGDIAGSVYEFNNIKTKDFELFAKECFFTDDSVMTVAVAKALMAYDNISEKNIEEFKESLITVMHDIGNRYPGCGYGGYFYYWLVIGESNCMRFKKGNCA